MIKTLEDLKKAMKKGEIIIWLCAKCDWLIKGFKNSKTPKCQNGGSFKKLTYTQYIKWLNDTQW